MRYATFIAVTGFFVSSSPWAVAAAPAVYPAPAGLYRSTDYAVNITKSGITQSSFTYQNVSDDLAYDHIEADVMMGIAANPALPANYRPQFRPKTRTVDWVRLTNEVRHDIDLARNATAIPAK